MYRVFLILLMILIPKSAYADGILLIPVLTLPGMIMALIPVIALEAGIYTRLLELPLFSSIGLSTIANIASTLLGNIIIGYLQFYIMFLGSINSINKTIAFNRIAILVFIFLFVITVIIEYVVAIFMPIKILKTYKNKYIFRAVLIANVASYAIIVFAIVFYNILETHYNLSH